LSVEGSAALAPATKLEALNNEGNILIFAVSRQYKLSTKLMPNFESLAGLWGCDGKSQRSQEPINSKSTGVRTQWLLSARKYYILSYFV
jgi:hypothetical protein